MKIITIILASILLLSVDLSAQDKSIEVNPAEQRFYNSLYVVIGLYSAIFITILGIIGAIIWRRKVALKSFEITTAELQKEVNLLKEKELKHLEKEMKMEFYIRQISQIDNRFAPFNP